MLKTYVHRPTKVTAICYCVDFQLNEFRRVLDSLGIRNYLAGKREEECLPRLNLVLSKSNRPTILTEGDWVVIDEITDEKKVLSNSKFVSLYQRSQS